MKIPVTPPQFKDEIDSWGEDAADNIELLMNPDVGTTDHKGRYLHWDRLRHITPPEGYNEKLYWFAIKSARNKISKKLAFVDKVGSPFKYGMSDGVMRDILWISENGTGAMTADGGITDVRTKQTYLINSLIEEAINSSQLEGATTTRRVAKEMIRTGRKPKDHSEKMVINNHTAMIFIRDIKEDKLTPSIIFELHKILTEGVLEEGDENKSGVFRATKDDICVFSKDDELLHAPPKASELKDRLQMICDFANKVGEDDTVYIPPIIRGIIIHFMIGYDHPFVDGNGRTARALFYWLMVKEGYWLMEYISISRVIKKAPAKYMYAYLHTETDENDMTYFIIHQLEVIKEAVKDLHAYFITKTNQLKEAEGALENCSLKGKLNFRQLSILKNALKNPGAEYTIKSHQSSHGVTYQTARTDLLKLADEYSLLKKYKVGKADVFLAPPDLKDHLGPYR